MTNEFVKTDTKLICNKQYCVYCAILAGTDSRGSYHNNDYEDFYICNCEGAVKAKSIEKRIYALKEELRILKQNAEEHRLNEVEYQEELRLLKNRFGKE